MAGKTITLEIEISDTTDNASVAHPSATVSSLNAPSGPATLVSSSSSLHMSRGISSSISHGTTVYALRGVSEVVLVANGLCGSDEKIDKTRIYGTIGAVICGLFVDYDVVDRHLKKWVRRKLRTGTRVTIEDLAHAAHLVLLTLPERKEEDAKTLFIFGVVEDGVPTIWTATRQTYTEFHGDFIAEGSGGHFVETYLSEKSYSSAWSIGRIIAIAKRAMVYALEDIHTGGVVRVVLVKVNEAFIVEKVSANELAILEEERLTTILESEAEERG